MSPVVDSDGYRVFTFPSQDFRGHFDKNGRFMLWDDKLGKMIATDFTVTKAKIAKSIIKERDCRDKVESSIDSDMMKWDLEANGGLRQEDMIYSPSVNYWWYCSNGHKYKLSLTSKYVKSSSYKCDLCANKTEGILHKWLVDRYGDIIYQQTFEWCKTPAGRKYLPFDFYIPSLNTVVELDGPQHFKTTGKWKCSRDTDVVKMKFAIAQGVRVVRVPQEVVWSKDSSWMDNLIQDIECKYKPWCMRSYPKFSYAQHINLLRQP